MIYNIEDFRKMIYGKELALQIQRFREGLKTIEKSHVNYFMTTPLLRREHKPNQLRFHYTTYYNGKVYGFGILNDSDLRGDIILECLMLFVEVFKSKFK